jgi:hypothetical protein
VHTVQCGFKNPVGSPREYNTVADNISKFSNTDDWEVLKAFFEYIDYMWWPHDIDRFATRH